MRVESIRDKQKIEQVKNIVKRQSYRNYVLIMPGLNTGLRIGDILSLKVKDVRNRNHIKLVEQKTRKDKKIKISRDLKMLLDEYVLYMDDNEYLFPSRKGDGLITRFQALHIIKEAAREAGLDSSEIGAHSLRKSFGYHHYQRNKDVALLQEIFNHSAPSITLEYIGINQDLMDDSLDDFSL